MILSPKGELKIVLLLQNNIIESYNLNLLAQVPQAVRASKITIGGHRSDVRTLAFSSDNIAILSAAAESVKIWNRYAVQLCQSPLPYVCQSSRTQGCCVQRGSDKEEGTMEKYKTVNEVKEVNRRLFDFFPC